MHMRNLVVLALAGAVLVGCSASELKSRKDDGWSLVSQGLPDGKYIHNPSLPRLSTLPDPTWVGQENAPNAYGHIFRPFGFVLHPVGVALDWAPTRPCPCTSNVSASPMVTPSSGTTTQSLRL